MQQEQGCLKTCKGMGLFMVDDVLINKAATIERCVVRAREEYEKNPATFGTDFTRQDAAILNIQRACEAALDLGQHLIRRERLGVPQSSRDVFTLLADAGWIDTSLADTMKRMVAYRNVAVHDYKTLQLPITVAIIQHHLGDFLAFTRSLIARNTTPGSARKTSKRNAPPCQQPQPAATSASSSHCTWQNP